MFFGKWNKEEDDGSQTQRKIFFVNMLQKSLAESVLISCMDSQVRERRGIDEEDFLNGSNDKQSNDDFVIVERRIVMTKTLRANQIIFLYDLCDLRSSSQTKL